MKAVLRIVLVLALVLGMVLGLSVTAQAEEPTTGTLRVTKVVEPDNYETDEEFPLQLYHVVDGVETPVGEPQSVQVGETAEWTGLEPGSYKVVETLTTQIHGSST